MLRALILALYDDFGRVVHLVGQTNGGVCHIDVLATSPARTVRVDPQARWIDFHFDGLIHFWRDEHCSERRMPSPCRIKRGNTYETMDTVLRFEIAKSITPYDLEHGVFDACFFTGLEIQDFVCISVRSSICAQSCDSVPPAPGWMDRRAFAVSISPHSNDSSSKCSIPKASFDVSIWTSWSTSASSASSAKSSRLTASSTWPSNFCQRSVGACSWARRFNTSWASSTSSQKLSRAIWASRAAISAWALPRSKMTSER